MSFENYGMACKFAADGLTKGYSEKQVLEKILGKGYEPRGGKLSANTVKTMASKWAMNYFKADGTYTEKAVTSQKKSQQKAKRRKKRLAAKNGKTATANPRVTTAIRAARKKVTPLLEPLTTVGSGKVEVAALVMVLESSGITSNAKVDIALEKLRTWV